MQNDFDHTLVEFTDRAKQIFFIAVEEFLTVTKKLDRYAEEYRFNRLKEQYVLSLKQRLESLASEYIRYNQHHKQLRELDQKLQEEIKVYLHQFVLRIRSL